MLDRVRSRGGNHDHVCGRYEPDRVARIARGRRAAESSSRRPESAASSTSHSSTFPPRGTCSSRSSALQASSSPSSCIYLLVISIDNVCRMELAADVEEHLRKFEGAESVDVHENGARVATINTFTLGIDEARWQACPSVLVGMNTASLTHRGDPFLHRRDGHFTCRSSDLERASRATRICPHRLQASIRRRSAAKSFARVSARILAEQFPDATLEGALANGDDLEHSLSGQLCPRHNS